MAAALAVFNCGFTPNGFKIVGAGDSKLATAVALFAGLHTLLQFFLYIALASGVLALCMLAAEPASAIVILHTRGRGRAFRGSLMGCCAAEAWKEFNMN